MKASLKTKTPDANPGKDPKTQALDDGPVQRSNSTGGVFHM